MITIMIMIISLAKSKEKISNRQTEQYVYFSKVGKME